MEIMLCGDAAVTDVQLLMLLYETIVKVFPTFSFLYTIFFMDVRVERTDFRKFPQVSTQRVQVIIIL
jgi:hypothetical protein